MIENPSFDTQTKESLMTPVKEFGSKPAISPKFLDQLVKIGLMDEAHQIMDAKAHKDAKKTDGKKKSKLTGIPKLEDATWAGTAKSAECTLILTEGDSAKTTAISGLKVVGRERYGVFPLKGKILNVKDATDKKKTENQEIQAIKQIVGLEHGKIYSDLKQLRYGRIMIMTDQDVDGSHIKGLLMNLFHTEWPSLLHKDFLCCLMTPLLKATKGSQTLCFYSETEYETWRESKSPSELRGWRVKYYKGLGTSTAAEAREYFANMNTVEFEWDKQADLSLDLAFNKKRANDRKEWLTTYDRKRSLNITAGGGRVNYTRFVNDELIHFSNADNIRSIPHIMDGLKPSQRKILWACLKRNLTSEIKVAQLAGYVSETAAYHHGEVSLQGAIVGMAQNFVGSNNINLLVPSGQFGTRLKGGDDASAPRYIFTALEQVTRFLMRKEDDAVLTYTEDDGQKVEPETYVPIIPTLLVNGAKGIGTGFSTTILQYNPRDLVGAMRARLKGMSSLESMTLTPWWADFKGRVVGSADGKTWVTRGVYEFEGDDATTIRIRELPVGTWTLDYKEFLEQMLVDQEEAKSVWMAECKKATKDKTPLPEKPAYWLQSYEEAYNDTDADFILHMDPDAYHEARAYPQEFEARFKLTSSYKTSNMVAFNTKGILKKYEAVGEILEEFYQERLRMYDVRKAHELKRMESEIQEHHARYVFVKAVVDKRLVVANAEDEDLLAGMKALDLPPLSDPESKDLRGYEYLLRMRVDRLKATAVAELEKELGDRRAKHATLAGTAVEEIWLSDLAHLETEMTTYFESRKTAKEEAAVAAPTVKKVVRKPRAKKV
jgi:DNA topoisomerase-2